MEPVSRIAHCPLWRRLAAIAYDSTVVLAVWMVVAALAMIFAGAAVEPRSLWFRALLLTAAWAYFAVCWIGGGQTLGMRAWRIRLRAGRRPVDVTATLVRFGVAWISALALGAGFAAAWWHPRRETWHDRASGTCLIVDPPPQPRRRSQ